ncbi:MAG: hypothetical protein AAF488_01435 [Planctomycetota bacterium]
MSATLRRAATLAVLLGIAATQFGCTTVQSARNDDDLFGGSRADLEYIDKRELYSERASAYGFLDFPFSLVADVVWFPVQMVAYSFTIWGDDDAPLPDHRPTAENNDYSEDVTSPEDVTMLPGSA